MFRTILFSVAILFSFNQLHAQALQSVTTFGSEGYDSNASTEYDSKGNLIIVGTFESSMVVKVDKPSQTLISKGGNDGYVCKYNSKNEFLWGFNIGGTEDDNIVDVSIYNDEIYIFGNFRGTVDFDPGRTVSEKTATNKDMFIAKYNSDGEYVYCIHISGTGYDTASKMVVSKLGIYIAGTFKGSTKFDNGFIFTKNLIADELGDMFIAKYSTAGEYQWAKKIDVSPAHLVAAIELDISGNVFIGGNYASTVDFDPGANDVLITSNDNSYDAFILKLSSTGTFMWIKTFGSADYECITSLKFNNNSIYAGGNYNGNFFFSTGAGLDGLHYVQNRGNSDNIVFKYSSNGDYQGYRTFGGSGQEYLTSLDFDETNNLYICGQLGFSPINFSTSTTTDYILNPTSALNSYYASYTNDLALRWATLLPSISVSKIIARGNNTFTVTGIFYNNADFDPSPTTITKTSNGNGDIFIAKYRPYYTLAAFSKFNIEAQVSSTISEVNKTINIVMPYNTDKSSLTSSYSLSMGASVNPTEIRDFTDTVTYLVTAEDTTIQNTWFVIVSNLLNNEAKLISFDIPAHQCITAIDKTNKMITVTMNEECNITALTPSILCSDGATCSPNTATSQDFTNPIHYTITSEDHSNTESWTVSVVPFNHVGISTAFTNSKLKVFPNPATNLLFIESEIDGNFSIYNQTGQCIKMEKQIKKGLNTIDISGIERGVYILKLNSTDKKYIQQIIIN